MTFALLGVSALGVYAQTVPGYAVQRPDPPTRAEGPASSVKSVGYLGTFLGDLTEERARALGLPDGRGAFVGKVVEGSPAAAAGVRENDVILSFNSEPVENAAQIYRLLSETPAGRTVRLGISRSGVAQNLAVTIGERRGGWFRGVRHNPYAEADAMREAAERLRQEAEGARQQQQEERAQQLLTQAREMSRQAEERRLATDEYLRQQRQAESTNAHPTAEDNGQRRLLLGLSVSLLTPQLAEFFQVKSGTGVLVTEVRPGTAAERAGLKAGDCITSLNGAALASASDLVNIAERAPTGEMILNIVRDRAELTLKLK